MSLGFISFPAPSGIADGCVLGGARLGPLVVPGVSWPEQWLAAPLLGAAPDFPSAGGRECWTAAGPLQSGMAEGIAWRRQGELLYGVISLDEADFAGAPGSALQAASESAYRRIFRLLEAQGLPHLWRAWNYLAHINQETAGLERYRQFNIGRQEAFMAHGRGLGQQMPAACALGFAGGPLSVAFLAGAQAATPIENPRQVSAYDYPAEYGPRSPSFSRAVLACPPGQELLLISGTASILGHRTVHPDDLLAQCDETLANIAVLLAEANRLSRGRPYGLADLDYRVYLRRAEDFPRLRARLEAALGPEVAWVCLQADICRADLLLEIEAQALQPLERP